MFNNDRLSHWCAAGVLGWAVSFVLLGVPVFRLWLGVRTDTIIAFTVLASCLQLVITPWLFSARATPQNPVGRPVKRSAAVIVWISLTALLLAYFVVRGSPDSSAKIIFFGTPVVAGSGALIALALVSLKKKAKGGAA